MTKVVIIGKNSGSGETVTWNGVSNGAGPIVIHAGTQEAMEAVRDALNAQLVPTVAKDGDGFQLGAFIVNVEDEVVVGDALDVDALMFKKHV